MTPQGWKPPTGIPPIPKGVNLYIIQAPADNIRNNKENGTGHREITAQIIASVNLGMTDNWRG